MNLRLVLDYLTKLEQNNSREWYHENKTEYLTAVAEFEALIEALTAKLRLFDPCIPFLEPGSLTFKLQRDTRFSHDKSPYNPSFRAHIAAKGKLPVPVGYFILLQPGGRSFLGGGLFADMFKDATAMVRDYLAAHGNEWLQIIESDDFAAHFAVGGSALKKVPQGYDPDCPQAEYLKNKSWYLEYPVSDEQLNMPDFIEYAADIFQKMYPFNYFLNQALENFVMPER